MSRLELFTYFRSSAAYRVRIVLHLKGVDFQAHFVDLLKEGGENKRAEYLELNPQGFVPTLIDGDHVYTQSLAIMEYLDEIYPSPPLLPESARERAYV
ncbi:MAG: maleylacetoacetate isomerase, partial [Burkholderiales bacterium]|nr:maleylacetoacetate isomerase [Burkholderiales bacterium]